MAEQIATKFLEELKKIKAGVMKAADEVTAKTEAHEKEQLAKFQKCLESQTKITNAEISHLELRAQLKSLTDAQQKIAAAKEIAVAAEKHEQTKNDELERRVADLRRADLDEEKGQNIKDMYQDMLEKLSEMHTVSRLSQREALTNERVALEEQVNLLTSQVAELRTEIEHLSAELEATGYEGLLHETRRSLMISMKDEYTKMKNELLRLRLANHALRIRTRNALETFKLTKP
ncbi:hypothetical protein V3C99_011067 [Haemonchus contortus]|nr:unnamed protein product [Haemonchus contortus]